MVWSREGVCLPIEEEEEEGGMEANVLMKTSLGVVDLNPCLSCILCGGYYIDATTITECLHSFCRACIVRYLETSKYCPVCDVRVHKTSPLRCIRSDKTLQDIVYKLVPGLYQNEMKGRRELYASQPPEALKESRDAEDRGEDLDKRFIYTADEIFNLALQYRHRKPASEVNSTDESCAAMESSCRYLRCPAAFKIFHLKKFIRLKYSIPQMLHISLQHQDETLDDSYSLMDVAYITSWKRMGPIELTFSVHERPQKAPMYFRASGVLANNSSVTSTESTLLQSTKHSDSLQENRQRSNEEQCGDDDVFNAPSQETSSLKTREQPRDKTSKSSGSPIGVNKKNNKRDSSSLSNPRIREHSRKSLHKSVQKHRRKRKISATIKKSADFENAESTSPPKVPKLTISLTPKILQIAALHAEHDRMDADNECYESRLVISEPAASPKESEGYCSDSGHSPKIVSFADLEIDEEERKKTVDDDEVDSGRGSDSSSRVENEDLGSPGSASVLTPDLEKREMFLLPSPSSLPSPTPHILEEVRSATNLSPVCSKKDDLGVLDLSTCTRGSDVTSLSRSKQVANPPVLDKFRQTNPCLPLSIPLPSYKMLPTVYAHSNNKKLDCSPGNYRYTKNNSFTVINPDPNSCRPKIVIKNLDPKRHHHHHHHHHHNHHH